MTTITAPTLAGYTLPHVAADGYHELVSFRGGFTEMASGSIQRDLLSTNPKIVFVMDWITITTDEADTIRTAYAAVVLADATLESPFGTAYTVQPDGQQPIDFRYFNTALGTRADISLRLREV